MGALRATAFVVGLALLGATAHVTIAHTGGYGTPHSVLTIAIAAGVGIGALCYWRGLGRAPQGCRALARGCNRGRRGIRLPDDRRKACCRRATRSRRRYAQRRRHSTKPASV